MTVITQKTAFYVGHWLNNCHAVFAWNHKVVLYLAMTHSAMQTRVHNRWRTPPPTVTDSLPMYITTDYAWIKGQGLKFFLNRSKNLLYVWRFVYFIQIRPYQVFPIHIFQSGTLLLSFKRTRWFLLTYRTSYLSKKYKSCTSCEN